MRNQSLFAPSALVLTLALALSACSPAPGEPAAPPAAEEPAPQTSAPPATTPASDPAPVGDPRMLGLEGLGELRIGQPVPAAGSWAERGAQESDACRTVTSPDYPGVYAIVEGGQVKRITVGQRSDVKLVEGIGAGAPESDVKKAFAGFRETPHKYEASPAKYLTAPNAESGESALRFEIGRDGKVKLIHVGVMPVLGYVEGCS